MPVDPSYRALQVGSVLQTVDKLLSENTRHVVGLRPLDYMLQTRHIREKAMDGCYPNRMKVLH